MILTKQDVIRLFEQGGYTIDERYPETGFIYFPTDGSRSKDSPDQGRVFWNIVKHEYPDTLVGRADRQLDKTFGMCRDALEIHPSWDRATDKQMEEIGKLLKHYVLFCRQQRPDYVPSLSEQEQAVEA